MISIRKLAFVGSYTPRQCGIATFTQDLCESFRSQGPDTETIVVPVNDRLEGYAYPHEARFEINEQDITSYERAADFLNFNNVEVVSLQHEFGIYGGREGAHILALLRELHMTVVTNLHTVLETPNADQMRVMRELDRLSSRFIVMTERSRRVLRDIYEVVDDRIDVIPHGIPDMPFIDPNFFKDQLGVEGKKVVLTFGLLSPGKGIENVIRALPKVVEVHPDLVYVILGATHPNLLREQGEAYRMSLERLANELGVKRHVAFYNRFVTIEQLKEFLGSADVYVTPYPNAAQAVSGTLAYAFGSGKAVVSTPYWHAEELLADGAGVLVPFDDTPAMAGALVGLFADDNRRNAMRKRAYLEGRAMTWNQVAHLYETSFQRARASGGWRTARRFSVKTLELDRVDLPDLRLEHLRRMTDACGIFQHATFSLPNYLEGYCSDDNARALILAVLLEQSGEDNADTRRWATSYAAFLNHAWNAETGRFRNFMSFDRTWLEDVGSEDSQGRVLWALGTCVGRSKSRTLQMWAAQLMEGALGAMFDTTSPRTWAFALLAVHEYFRKLSGDRVGNALRTDLSARLVELYRNTATPDWQWFEPVLSYDNAKLAHALILSGRWMQDEDAFQIGLESLRWLTKVQTAPQGHFRPIGSDGFFRKGGERAIFDQQPLEAQSTVSACIEAYACTQDDHWLQEARKAFEWFLGRNDVGAALYEPQTGGTFDALHVDRVNQNQGAESTLAFLLALQEMRLLENSLQSYKRPVE